MSDRRQFIDAILDHYENPRCHGALENADLVQTGTNPGCGDVVTIYVRLGENETVARIGFEGSGCTISQAAASVISDKVVGKTLAEISKLDHEIVAAELGPEVVTNRHRCATLALSTLQAAGKKYRPNGH